MTKQQWYLLSPELKTVTVKMGGWRLPAWGYRVDYSAGTLRINLAGRLACRLLRILPARGYEGMSLTYKIRG